MSTAPALPAPRTGSPADSLEVAHRFLAAAPGGVHEASALACRLVHEALGVSAVAVSLLDRGAPAVVASVGSAEVGLEPVRFGDEAARAEAGLRTHLGVPMRGRNGEVVGHLHAVDASGVPVGTTQRHLVEVLTGLVAPHQERELADRARQRTDHHRAQLGQLSRRALQQEQVGELLTDGARLLADALGGAGCDVLEVRELPDRGWHWRPWAGTGPASAAAPAAGEDGPPWTATTDGCPVDQALHGDGAVVLPAPGGPTCGPQPSVTVLLASSDGPLGVLLVYAEASRDYREDELRMAEAVADMLTSAVVRRRDRASLQWRAGASRLFADVSARFNGVSALDTQTATRSAMADVGEYIRARHVVVHRATHTSAEAEVAHAWSAAEGGGDDSALTAPAREAATRLGRAVHLPPEDERAVSVVCVPLIAAGRALGTISFVAQDTSVRWPDDIGERLTAFADVVAAAKSRQRASAELEASELRYRTLVDSVTDVIVHLDGHARLSFVNQAWTGLTDLTPEESLGTSIFERIHPEDHPVFAAQLQAGVAGRDDLGAAVRFLAADGTVRWIEASGRALLDADGGTVGYSGVLHDITARHDAEAQVRLAAEQAESARAEAESARDEAERASRAKSEFLSRMSHELRTPLNAILGFGQLLELGDLPQEEAESVEQILRAGRHLLDLINEVLDVVRIESGVLSLSMEPVGVGEVVGESLDLVRHAAAARGLTLRAPARHCGLDAIADRQRLKQVLINLISNAVKYNADDGKVVVRCTALDAEQAPAEAAAGTGWLRISVEDTGPGIAPAHLERVFTPFERLGAEGTGIEGTGIGLSVTKALVEALGGTIGVRSEVGRGTAFWVDLPAVLATGAGDAAAPGADAAGPAGAPVRTVLYVEDNPANAVLVRRIVERRPHLRLTVVHDGADGFEEARRARPDLVLLDLHLPTMDGAEVLRALRADPEPQVAAVPVVVVTADASRGTEVALLAAGATSFLPKPLDVRALLTVLDQEVPAL